MHIIARIVSIVPILPIVSNFLGSIETIRATRWFPILSFRSAEVKTEPRGRQQNGWVPGRVQWTLGKTMNAVVGFWSSRSPRSDRGFDMIALIFHDRPDCSNRLQFYPWSDDNDCPNHPDCQRRFHVIIISTDHLHISPDRLRTSDLDDYMGTRLHVSATKCHLQITQCK